MAEGYGLVLVYLGVLTLGSGDKVRICGLGWPY